MLVRAVITTCHSVRYQCVVTFTGYGENAIYLVVEEREGGYRTGYAFYHAPVIQAGRIVYNDIVAISAHGMHFKTVGEKFEAGKVYGIRAAAYAGYYEVDACIFLLHEARHLCVIYGKGLRFVHFLKECGLVKIGVCLPDVVDGYKLGVFLYVPDE